MIVAPRIPPTGIAGLKFSLYAASDRYDTDWAIRVTDVYPDGRSILVTDNILKARHRHGFDREDLLIPNVPDTFNIDLWSIATVFNTGHRIRVLISSSNYPRFEKNPNTGAPFRRDDPNFVVATQKNYRTTTYPSHLLLPVIPSQVSIKELFRQSIVKENISIPTIAKFPKISIILNKSSHIEISLYNTLGRRIWYLKKFYLSGKHDLELPTLQSGVYFVQTKIDGNVKVKRITIIK